MTKNTEKKYFDLRKFALGLRQLTESLPTENDKAKLRAQFEEMISFLTKMANALEALPSVEHTENVRKALDAFGELATRAKTNPILSVALGLNPPRRASPPSAAPSLQEHEKAETLLTQLRSLPIDDMNARLGNADLTSARELAAVASLLGIKTNRKQGRDLLVQQIVKKISNFRGYEELQGHTAPQG
jgi:hypothetical protein